MTRLLLPVLLLTAAPAAAVEPWDCPAVLTRSGTPTFSEEDMLPYPGEDADVRLRWGTGQVTDRGAGIVATETSREHRFRGEDSVRFEHCASGQGFQVTVRAWDKVGERRLGPDPYALMRDVITSPERNTWDEVRRMFGDFAGPLVTAPAESCACAAFYPALRGDRAPYSASSQSH